MRLLALGALNLFLLSASEAFVSPSSYLSERKKLETSSTTVVNPSPSVSHPSKTSLHSTTNWNELKQQKIRLTQQSNRNHMAQTIKACKVLNFHPKMQFSKSGVVLDLDMKFVKKAYRQMALAHHPDYLLSSDATEEERQAANDRFAKINQAYTFLTSTKRYYHQDLNENGQVKVVQRDRTTQKNFGHDPSVPFLRRVNEKYQERNQKVVKGNIASEKTAASPKFVDSVKKAVNPRDQHIFSEMREQDRRMVVNPTQPTQPFVPKRVLNQKIQTFGDGNDMAVEKLDDGTSSEMVGSNELNGNETPLEHPQAQIEAVADMEHELGDKEKKEATLHFGDGNDMAVEKLDDGTSSEMVGSNELNGNETPLEHPQAQIEAVADMEHELGDKEKKEATLHFGDGNDMAVEKLDDGTSSEMVGSNELNGNETPLEHPQAQVEAVADMEHELGDKEKKEATLQIAQEQVGTNTHEHRDKAPLQVPYNQDESMTVEENQLDEQKEKLPLQIPYNPMETINGVEKQIEIEQKEQTVLQGTQASSESMLGDVNQPDEQNKQVAIQFPPNQVEAEATVHNPHNQVGAEVTANLPQAGVKAIDGGNNQSSEKNEKIQVGVQVPQGQSEAMETTFVQQKEEVALETAKVDNGMNKVNDDEQKHSQSPQFPEQQLYRVVNYVEIQEPAEEEQKDEQGLVIQWKKTRKSSIDEKRNTARKEDNSQKSNISGTKVNFQLEAIDKKEIDDMASPDLLRIEQELPASSELSSVDDTLILSWLKENEIEEEVEERMKFASRKECLLHYIKKKNFLPQVGTTKSSPAGMMQKILEDAMAESNVSNISQDDISKLSLNVGGSQEGRHGTSHSAVPSVSQNTMTENQKPRRIEVVRRQVNVVERKTNAITPVESANRPRLNVNDSHSHKQVNRAALISPIESANRPRLNVNEVRSKSVNESANRPRLNVNEVRSKSSTISKNSSTSNQRSNHMRPPQVVPKAKKATMNWTTDDASITPKNDSVARPPKLNRKVEVTRNSTPLNNGTMNPVPSQASPCTTSVNGAARVQHTRNSTPLNNGTMNPVPSQASPSTTAVNDAAGVQQRRVEVPRTVQNNNQVQSPLRTSSPSTSSATKTTKQSNDGWGSTDTTRSLKQEVPTVDDGNQKLVPNAVKKRTPNSIHSRQEIAVKPKKDKVQFPTYPKKELLQHAVKRKVAASGMMGSNNKVEFPAYPKDVATTSTQTNEPKSQTAPVNNQSMKQTVTTQAKEQNPYLRTPEEEEELRRQRENVEWKWSTTPNLDTKVRR